MASQHTVFGMLHAKTASKMLAWLEICVAGIALYYCRVETTHLIFATAGVSSLMALGAHAKRCPALYFPYIGFLVIRQVVLSVLVLREWDRFNSIPAGSYHSDNANDRLARIGLGAVAFFALIWLAHVWILSVVWRAFVALYREHDSLTGPDICGTMRNRQKRRENGAGTNAVASADVESNAVKGESSSEGAKRETAAKDATVATLIVNDVD